MKLWLDDLRSTPPGFESARSVNEARDLIEAWESESETIGLLDIDYDLGRYGEDGGNGQDFLLWLLERETYYPVQVHSSDINAAANMEGLIEAFWNKRL